MPYSRGWMTKAALALTTSMMSLVWRKRTSIASLTCRVRRRTLRGNILKCQVRTNGAEMRRPEILPSWRRTASIEQVSIRLIIWITNLISWTRWTLRGTCRRSSYEITALDRAKSNQSFRRMLPILNVSYTASEVEALRQLTILWESLRNFRRIFLMTFSTFNLQLRKSL